MSSSEVRPAVTSHMVIPDHPHLLSIVTVDLKVVQIKYILRRLTEHLKVIMSNANDANSPPNLRDHYKEQQRLLLDLIVTLQDAMDREPTDDA